MENDNEKIYTTLGNNVRFFRNLERLSQSELAEKSGVSAAYISQIEICRLHKGVTCTTVMKMAQALEVPACVLMAETPCQKYLQCLEKAALG